MDQNMIRGLIDNIAILLALGLIYDVIAFKSWIENKVAKSISGVVLGLIGMFVMLNPWEYGPGIFFDTRSIVLSVGGLFFGTVPAIIAMLMTSTLRIYQGGIGMYPGLGVIITSGLFGVMLRHYKLGYQNNKTLVGLRLNELFGLGLIVHISMLLWMFLLPIPMAKDVLRILFWPVLLLYPLGSMLLGQFIIGRVKRITLDLKLASSEKRYRNFVDNASDAFYLTDISGKIHDVNETACNMLGYTRQQLLNFSIEDIDLNYDPQEFQKSREEIIAGKMQVLGTIHKHNNGEFIPVDVRVRSYSIDDESMFMSLVRDISERTQNEAALRMSEERFRMLTIHSPVGIFFNDAAGNVTYINNRCPELIGVSADEAMNFDWFSAIHPQDREKVTTTWSETIATGGEFHMDYRWLHPDGKVVWTSGNIVPVKDQNGQVSMFVGTLTNISRRKLAEQELERSENRFRNVAENMSDWIWETDISGNYSHSSENIEAILGYRPGEIIGKSHTDFMEPKEAERVGKIFKNVVATKKSFRDLENWNISKDGKKVCLLTSGVPIIDNDGALLGYRGVDSDITERKLAEGELEQTMSLLNAIFDAMPDALLAVDPSRHIIRINKSFSRILGYSESEILGKKSSHFYESEAEFIRQGKLRYNLSADEQLAPYTVKYRRKDGSLFSGETLGVPIYNQAHEKIGFIGIIRDISDRLQLENTLRQSQKLEAVGTMVGGISHELNNILQSLFLYGGLIQDDLNENSDAYLNLKQLLADGERARDLVNQILTFSRKTKIDFQPQTVHKIILNALDFERASLSPNIDIHHRIDKNCGMVMCDETQIHQIILNLCNNAQHAMMAEGGILTVSLQHVRNQDLESSGDRYLEIKVGDTGKGMDKATLERIFDPFYTTKPLGEGTGLGLSVIHGIIEMMEGEIMVESELGVGTTFSIKLPIVEVFATEIPPEPNPIIDQQRLSILLVDDEVGILKATQTAMTRKGFSMDVARHGKEALEIFQKNSNKYDLIITDLSMPNMSGVDLSMAIRKLDAKLPVLLSTGHLGLNDMIQYENAGISGFIQKPWTIDQLMSHISELKLTNRKNKQLE